MEVDARAASRTQPLHKYACFHCRQRRIKCDKILSGCENCKRYELQCLYSARRPRKTQKSHPEPTFTRPLRPVPQSQSSNRASSYRGDEGRADSLGSDLTSNHSIELSQDYDNEEDEEEEDAMIPRSLRNRPNGRNNDTTTTDHGRLTVDSEGRSHYIDSEKNIQVWSTSSQCSLNVTDLVGLVLRNSTRKRPCCNHSTVWLRSIHSKPPAQDSQNQRPS
jgi:hypothetical protein